MTGNPYRTFGTSAVPMLGRDRLFAELCRRLDRLTPENVSLIGPRYYGKSVILRRLASEFENGKEGHANFVGAFYWDLSSQPPPGDLGFLKRLCELTKAVLQNKQIAEAMLIDSSGADFDGILESLKYVLGELQKRDLWLLGMLDGIERPLMDEGLTRNLWGNLRFLASESESTLRLVTASRQPLSEICMTEGARDSHFHTIFGSAPVIVEKFVDADLPSLFAPFVGHAAEVDLSAQRELMQHTGGIPLLVAAVLGRVYDEASSSDTIQQPQITDAVTHVSDVRRDVLKALWDDCSSEMQDDLVAMQYREVRREELSPDQQSEHEIRGLAAVSGGALKLRSRMMGAFAKRQNTGTSDIKRLFGDEERFRDNIRPLLEVRRDHIARSRMTQIDPTLFNLLQHAIIQVREPVMSISLARMIRNRALELIWNVELPGGVVPPQWLAEFKAKWTDATLPQPSGASMYLLQLATGSDQVRRVTKKVSKRTYVLLNFVHSIGDHGQHADPTELTWAYSVAFCLTAIEMMESLAQDLA